MSSVLWMFSGEERRGLAPNYFTTSLGNVMHIKIQTNLRPMKDTDLLGLECAGDNECCGQGREEIFLPEGPAFVVFPALRVGHSPGKATKDQTPSDEASPFASLQDAE